MKTEAVFRGLALVVANPHPGLACLSAQASDKGLELKSSLWLIHTAAFEGFPLPLPRKKGVCGNSDFSQPPLGSWPCFGWLSGRI